MKTVDIVHLPTDDAATWEIFATGKTVRIAPFDQAICRQYLRRFRPKNFAQLVDFCALFQPGAIERIDTYLRHKYKIESITYDLPCMEKYLHETYGVLLYKEQLMQLAEEIAGFSSDESAQLPRVFEIGIFTQKDELYTHFLKGGQHKGYVEDTLCKIWHNWEHIGHYLVDKAQATEKAWLAYQMAYLQVHYPDEFIAAGGKMLSDSCLIGHQLEQFMTTMKKHCTLTAAEWDWFVSLASPSDRLYAEQEEQERFADWLKTHENKSFTIGCFVDKVEDCLSIKGNPYKKCMGRDDTNTITFLLCGDMYEKYKNSVQANNFVLVTGTIQQLRAHLADFVPKALNDATYEYRVTEVKMIEDTE